MEGRLVGNGYGAMRAELQSDPGSGYSVGYVDIDAFNRYLPALN
jgi:hypothetical protein